MNRRNVEDAVKAAKMFIESASYALLALDVHQDEYETWAADREERPVRKTVRHPSDNAATGTKESGQMRRDSLDLTRRLADLRRST